jgi:hypothetical protein
VAIGESFALINPSLSAAITTTKTTTENTTRRPKKWDMGRPPVFPETIINNALNKLKSININNSTIIILIITELTLYAVSFMAQTKA